MRKTINIEKGLKTYLAVAVKYSVINRSVKRRRDNRFIESLTHRTSHLDLSTEEAISYNELKKNLMQSISFLPERCQLVFRLRFEKDYSQKQIADELSISEKTVEAHLSKARKHIRTSLGSTLSVSIVSILDAILK